MITPAMLREASRKWRERKPLKPFQQQPQPFPAVSGRATLPLTFGEAGRLPEQFAQLSEEEQARQVAISRGETHYLFEGVWKVAKRAPKPPLTGMPFEAQLEQLGDIPPFKQIGEFNEEIQGFLRTPEGQIATLAAGVIAIFTGAGIPALQQGWRTLTNVALVRQISRMANERNIKISQDEAQIFAMKLRELAKQKGFKWDLDKSALKDFFKPFGQQTAPTPAAAKKAEDMALAALNKYGDVLIPRGTQTGAMTFGGKIPPSGVPPIEPTPPAVEGVGAEAGVAQARKDFTPEQEAIYKQEFDRLRVTGVDRNSAIKFAREVARGVVTPEVAPEAPRAITEPVKPPATPRPPEVPSGEVAEAPPVKPSKITNPEWTEFWVKTQNLGLTNKEVHQYLGVESVKEWEGTLQKAIEKLTPMSEAKNIAINKALISETGKTTDQYRRLAQNITGKKDIKDMTSEEVVKFTEALERYPDKKWSTKTGGWIPQSIPKTTALVPENYFNIEFKEPTVFKLLTSQNYYATKLGLSPLTQPLEIAKQKLDLVYPAWATAVEGKVRALDKAYKVTTAEKFIAARNNKPTRASAEMAQLLNKYEDLPADLVAKLGDEKVKLFSWFRNLSRTILNAENQVRELLNMPLIPNRQAYYRHIATETAKEVWQGNYSLPSDLAYWSSRIVGKKVFNPMEIQRKVADDILEYFSKDLGYVTKSMLWTGLKEIYLSQPLKSFTAQLSVLSKGMMPFSSLSPQELAKAEAVATLPASTHKWVVDYVNAIIKGQQTEFDASINRMLTDSGIGKLFDTLLKEFGRSIGTKPVTKMAEFSGRLVINATIGTKPRQIIRNLHQSVQNLALYGITPTLRAFLPAGKTLSRLLDQSLFLKTYARVEELPPSAMGKIERTWMWAYGRSAIFNARTGMKAAYHGTTPLITNKGNAKYGWASPERTYKEERGFLYPDEERNLIREMEFGAGATQYQYLAMGMPEIFRYKTLIPFTRLQSWWMNYFFKFNREAMGRFWNGHVGWDKNLKLPPTMRLNWLKYLVLGGAVLTAMGYSRSFMKDVLPHWASPAGQFMVGAYNYVTAGSDRERENSKKGMFYSLQAFAPGLIDYKMYNEVWKGERPMTDIFFYTEDLPPDLPTWGIPFLEEEVNVKNRIKEANTEIPKFREQLGQTIPAEDGVEEYVYDMNDLGSDIRAILRNIPPERITVAEGFPDIAVMYNQSLPMIDGYYSIPAGQRKAFIKQNTPESIWTGAYLVIWGKLKVTGWVSSNPSTLALIEQLKKDYGIPSSVIPKTAIKQPTTAPAAPKPPARTPVSVGGGITDRMLQEALK